MDNYARFYTLLRKLPGADKETLVYQFTKGRTSSLREMSDGEYRMMCNEMERVSGEDARREAWLKALKRRRSVCLKLMQELGIDTTDWSRVDDFCRHPRIAAKMFRQIGVEELENLAVKLRAIQRNGGLKPREQKSCEAQAITVVMNPNGILN